MSDVSLMHLTQWNTMQKPAELFGSNWGVKTWKHRLSDFYKLHKSDVYRSIKECNLRNSMTWIDIRGRIQAELAAATTTIINTRWEATQNVMAAKLTRLTYKTAMRLHLVAESSTIWSSRARRPVRKLLDTPSYGAI